MAAGSGGFAGAPSCREVDAEHPEGVRRAVAEARQRPRLHPGARVDARGRLVGRGVDDRLGATVRPGRLDVDDGLPRPWGGQAPAVPAGHDLVEVVGGRVGVAVERGQLQEADVGGVGEDGHVALAGDGDPALVQAVPGLARVVPDLQPDAAHDVVEEQVPRGRLQPLGCGDPGRVESIRLRRAIAKPFVRNVAGVEVSGSRFASVA